MKKFMFLFLIILTVFTITPNALAASQYGTVTDITKKAGDSLSSGEGTIQTTGNTTTIKYSVATFKMLKEEEQTADGQRPGPAAWIGFEVTKPDNDSPSFKVTTPDNKTSEIKQSSYRDYVGITPDNLKKVLLNGTMLTYKYSFDWDNNNSTDQYVIIEIDPKGITLTSEDGNQTSWSPAIAQNILDEQNPSTSDINIPFLLILIAIGSLGLIYCFKRA